MRIGSPRPLEHTLRLQKRRSKQHSRKKPGSANRKKSALGLGCLHRRIRNKRKDFLRKLSTQLSKTKSAVVIEDLNVRGIMQNHHLSRHIADSGRSRFFTKLSYKTEWYGSRLIKAPRFYPSSKTCCVCGSIKPELSLKERQFVCGICGFTIDRDENAARNLEYLSTSLDNKHPTGTTGSSGGKLRLWRHLWRRNPSTDFGGVYESCVIETGIKYQIFPWDIWVNSVERYSAASSVRSRPVRTH